MADKRTYSEKLRDPRWQKLRLEVQNRDGWSCRWCGDKTKELHVHHINYVSGNAPWDYPASDLMSLCLNCHKTLEEYISKAREILAVAGPDKAEYICRICEAVSAIPAYKPVPNPVAVKRPAIFRFRRATAEPTQETKIVQPETPQEPYKPTAVERFLNAVATRRPPLAARLGRANRIEARKDLLYIYGSDNDNGFADALNRHAATIEESGREVFGNRFGWYYVPARDGVIS